MGLESVAAATKMTNSAHAYVMEQKTNKPNAGNITNRRQQSQDDRMLEMCKACNVCIQWATKSKCLKGPTCRYMHKWPSKFPIPNGDSSSKSRQTPTPYRGKRQGIHTLEDLDPALFLLDGAEEEQDTHWSNAGTHEPSDQEQENDEYEFNMLQHQFEATPDLLDSEDEDARPDSTPPRPPVLRDHPTGQPLLRKLLLAKEALVYGMAAAASIKCQVHTPTLIMELPLDRSLLPPGATTWLDRGVFECELCSAALTTAYAWYQHVRGQRHQRTQEHFIMGSVSPYYYCTQCDSVSAHKNEHESGKRHRKRLAAKQTQPASSTAHVENSPRTSTHSKDAAIQYASEAGGEILSRLDAIIQDEFARLRERILATVFNHFEEGPEDGPAEEIHTLTLDGSDSTDTHIITDQWVFDTGATICATDDARDCYDIESTSCKIRQAGKDIFTVKLKGRLKLNCDRSAFGLAPLEVSTQLGWCLISPNFSKKIVAAAPLLRAGWTMQGSAEKTVLFLPDGTPAMTARPSPILLIIQLAPHQLLTLTKALRPTRKDLVARILIGHLALAHISYQEVARILKLQLPPDLPACFVCAIVSPRVSPHDKTSVREPEYVGQMWSFDIKGPYQVPGLNGELYDLLFTELMFMGVFIFPITSPTMEICFEKWLKLYNQHVARFNGKNKVALVIHDQTLSFNNNAFDKHAVKEGYTQSNTSTYEHWQNPTENSIGKIVPMKKKNLLQSGFPPRMHSIAGQHAVDAYMAALPTGRCAARVPEEKKDWSRGELTLGRQSAEHGLRVIFPFGCMCVKIEPMEKVREDFLPRGSIQCHLRYDQSVHEYLMMHPATGVFSASFRVRHHPTVFPKRLRGPCNLTSLAYESHDALEVIQKEVQTHAEYEALIRHDPRLLLPPREKSAQLEELKEVRVAPERGPDPATIGVIPTHSRRRGWNPSARALENLAQELDVQEMNQEGEEIRVLRHTEIDGSAAPGGTSPAPTAESDVPLIKPANAGQVRLADDEPLTPDDFEQMTPTTVAQALAAPGLLGRRFTESLLTEYDSLKKDNVFQLENLMKRGDFTDKPLATKLVFRIKSAGKTSLQDIPKENFRARTTVRGDQSIQGVHYTRRRALVARPESLRIIMAMAVDQNLQHMGTADVQRAFRYPTIDRRVVVKLPPGFNPYGPGLRPIDAEPLYAVLNKGLEGLKQGALLFFEDFSEVLKQAGLYPTKSDPCVFVSSIPKSIFFKDADKNPKLLRELLETAAKVVAILHVDDVLVVSSTQEGKDSLMLALEQRYTIKKSPLKEFLGIEFKVSASGNNRSIFLSQPRMARTILQRAGMEASNPSKSPLMPGTILEAHLAGSEHPKPEALSILEHQKFRSTVMALNWMACNTRPPLKYPVGKLAKYIAHPTTDHAKALKQVLRFLAGTQRRGIKFSNKATSQTNAGMDASCIDTNYMAYADSSHNDDKATGKSTIAYCIFRGGGLVSWFSKLSPMIPRSPQQSEFFAFEALILELVWLAELQKELRYKAEEKIVARMDNAGVISAMTEIVHHQTSKHYKLRIASVRELLAIYQVQLQKVAGALNPANALTKMLSGTLADVEYRRIEDDGEQI